MQREGQPARWSAKALAERAARHVQPVSAATTGDARRNRAPSVPTLSLTRRSRGFQNDSCPASAPHRVVRSARITRKVIAARRTCAAGLVRSRPAAPARLSRPTPVGRVIFGVSGFSRTISSEAERQRVPGHPARSRQASGDARVVNAPSGDCAFPSTSLEVFRATASNRLGPAGPESQIRRRRFGLAVFSRRRSMYFRRLEYAGMRTDFQTKTPRGIAQGW